MTRMNKRLTATVLAFVLPVGIASYAAGETAVTEKLHTPVQTASAVDLDAAMAKFDTLPMPAKVSSDSVYVRNSDGYVQSRGNVDVQRGTSELHTSYMEGNMKTGTYETKGPTIYINDDQVITADGVVYNTKDNSATVATVAGYTSNDSSALYFRGQSAKMADGSVYIKHGLITTPHAVAKTPDYYLTADDIRIYPGKRVTAENTKLWFKHVLVLTYGHYESSLAKESGSRQWIFSLLPKPSYNSDDGLGLKGKAEFPLSKDGSLAVKARYAVSVKSGFKPSLTLEKNTKAGTFTFGYSKEVSSNDNDNDDHIWVTKWPEFHYYTPRLYFGNSGIYAFGSAEYGKWQESDVGKGTHKGMRAEITHDPIDLWKGAEIRGYAGYRKDWYEIGDNVRKDPYWGIILKQNVTDRLWTTFWYKRHNISGTTPYRFDSIENPDQKGLSVGYVLTPRDTFIFSIAKDLDDGHINERDFTWVRDLHSFVGTVTYKQVKKKWEVKVTAKDFD